MNCGCKRRRKPMDNDLRLKTIQNMREYGGSFVKALAEAMLAADEMNLRMIEATWPEYMDRYHPKNWPNGKDE